MQLSGTLFKKWLFLFTLTQEETALMHVPSPNKSRIVSYLQLTDDPWEMRSILEALHAMAEERKGSSGTSINKL